MENEEYPLFNYNYDQVEKYVNILSPNEQLSYLEYVIKAFDTKREAIKKELKETNPTKKAQEALRHLIMAQAHFAQTKERIEKQLAIKRRLKNEGEYPLFNFNWPRIVEFCQTLPLDQRRDYLMHVQSDHSDAHPDDKGKPPYEVNDIIRHEMRYLFHLNNYKRKKIPYPLFDFNFDLIRRYAENEIDDPEKRLNFYEYVLKELYATDGYKEDQTVAAKLQNEIVFLNKNLRIQSTLPIIHPDNLPKNFVEQVPIILDKSLLTDEKPAPTKKLFWEKDIDDLVMIFLVLLKFGFLRDRSQYATFIALSKTTAYGSGLINRFHQ